MINQIVKWMKSQGVKAEINEVRKQMMDDFSDCVDGELTSLSDCSYKMASDFIEWLDDKLKACN